MKISLLILFLVIAISIDEAFSDSPFSNRGSVDPWGGSRGSVDPWGGSRGSKDPWGGSRGPSDYRCGTSFGRKKRGINKKYKEQTFYQYDHNSNQCVSYKSSSSSPGSTGFSSHSECESVCVQRKG